MYFLFLAPFLFPLAPWFAKTPRGAWLVCGAVVSVLALLFPAMFSWGCKWSSCGQGAIAIFMLAPIWLFFAVITTLSAWAAAGKRARTLRSDPHQSVP
jgi:membrane protein implicated in regulation of membrane protease activity